MTQTVQVQLNLEQGISEVESVVYFSHQKFSLFPTQRKYSEGEGELRWLFTQILGGFCLSRNLFSLQVLMVHLEQVFFVILIPRLI